MQNKYLSIADQVFEKLENDILTGVYKRGDVLTELGLSDKLGVSRTPIREAVSRLEQEKLVQYIPKGIKVVGISLDDVILIYEMRERIEGMAASLACDNATEEQLNKIKDLLELQEFFIMKDDSYKIKNTDSDFHELLYEASGSVHLSHILSELHKKAGQYRRASVTDKNRAKLSLKEHLAIYESIVSKNKQKAEELTREHVKNAKESIINSSGEK